MARSIEATREAKRLHMARKRAEDPQKARDYHRARYYLNHETNKNKMSEYQRKRFFWRKSYKLAGVEAKDLAKLWKDQRGFCGLTGRKMDKSAHLDHIVPKAKGGGDDIQNLRWVCMEANLAKRDILDTDFIKLCMDVISKAKNGLL